jgi:hypothetical protein
MFGDRPVFGDGPLYPNSCFVCQNQSYLPPTTQDIDGNQYVVYPHYALSQTLISQYVHQ